MSDIMYPRRYNYFSKLVMVLAIACLSACLNTKKPQEEVPQAAPTSVKALQYSPKKIVDLPKKDVRFAQTALIKLGFKIGAIDGLWGPRSARAIRQFELQNDITSANGHLSELNLKWLERMTLLSRSGFEDVKRTQQRQVAKKTGISSQLKESVPLSNGPQLVIVDREYTVLTKPNPYSSTIARIEPGTGIYVIGKQDGWFEVESIDRKRGFLPID